MGSPTELHGSLLQRVWVSLQTWMVVGTLGSVGLALFGTSLGAVPPTGVMRWWFFVPRGSTVLAGIGFYGSVVLLLTGWIGVGVHARRGHLSVRRAWLILAMWGVPLLLGPPLFSRDLYSYVGQGLLAHRGLNPYSVAPSHLGSGPLLSSIASVWRNTDSPYGPLFVELTRWAAAVSGGSLIVQVLVFRAMEMVGVALIMVSIPRLCRRLGTSPGLGLWLAALSPLALFGFIASGHNDALMVGMLLLGVTLVLEGRFTIGIALCAVAATIKLPAAGAIAFLVADRLKAVDRSARWKLIVEAVAIPAAVMVGITLLVGLGWTWLGTTALHVPTELRVLSTPSVAIGTFFFAILHGVGLPVAKSATITIVQTICEVAALSAIVWLLVNTVRLEVVRVLGLTMLIVVVGSPTVWPWYLLWGLTLLAVTKAQRSLVLAVVGLAAMLVVGPSGSPLLVGGDFWWIAPMVILGLGWMTWNRNWYTVVVGRAY